MTPRKRQRATPQRTREEIDAASAREARRLARNFDRRVRREMQKSGKTYTNARRAVRTRDAWKEARTYAKRHGTTPTLAKRAAPLTLSNKGIVAAWDNIAKRRGRTRGGRTSERRRDTEFRVVIRRKDGTPLIDKNGRPVPMIASDPLLLPGNATAAQLRKAIRNAIFATLGADLEYEAGIGELDVDDAGDVSVDGDALLIELENYTDADAQLDLLGSDDDE